MIHNISATDKNEKDLKSNLPRTKFNKNKDKKFDGGEKSSMQVTEDSNITSKQIKSSVSLNSSKNKRKNSLPLKVKMPFKMSKKSTENSTQIRNQGIRQSDDDVDL